jgi:hypothetical protein
MVPSIAAAAAAAVVVRNSDPTEWRDLSEMVNHGFNMVTVCIACRTVQVSRSDAVGLKVSFRCSYICLLLIGTELYQQISIL